MHSKLQKTGVALGALMLSWVVTPATALSQSQALADWVAAQPDSAAELAEQDTRRSGDRWLSGDKFQHFFGSALLTGLGYATLHKGGEQSRETSLWVGSGVSLSAGIGKEIYDSKHENHHASFKDLLADLLGVGFAVVLISTL